MSDDLKTTAAYAALIVELKTSKDRIGQLEEELSIWKPVFPDIAPERVQPNRSLMEKRIEQLEAALFESMALNINYHAVEENDGYQFTEAPAVIEMARAALEGKKDKGA